MGHWRKWCRFIHWIVIFRDILAKISLTSWGIRWRCRLNRTLWLLSHPTKWKSKTKFWLKSILSQSTKRWQYATSASESSTSTHKSIGDPQPKACVKAAYSKNYPSNKEWRSSSKIITLSSSINKKSATHATFVNINFILLLTN